jgi:c-di-GMP-binding flagellar brake protein YcgR
MQGIPEKMQKTIVHHFLPKGFELFEAKNVSQIKNILEKKQVNFLLVDLKLLNNHELQFSNAIEASLNMNLKTIGFGEKGEFPDFVNYTLNKYSSEHKTLRKLSNILTKSGIKPTERRRHVRVKTGESEKMAISFYIDDDLLLNGKINDISIGGAVFKMDSKENLDKLPVDSRIENIELDINGKIIKTSVVIVYKKDYFLAVRFVELKKDFIKTVAEYIYEKLSETGGIRN